MLRDISRHIFHTDTDTHRHRHTQTRKHAPHHTKTRTCVQKKKKNPSTCARTHTPNTILPHSQSYKQSSSCASSFFFLSTSSLPPPSRSYNPPLSGANTSQCMRKCQKRPIYMTKEAYSHLPMYAEVSKETYLYDKRGLFI